MFREKERRDNQRNKLLRALRYGPATNVELSTISLRFGARIKELRDDGYTIETKRVGPGLFQYTLF